jgi:hypothetical protein
VPFSYILLKAHPGHAHLIQSEHWYQWRYNCLKFFKFRKHKATGKLEYNTGTFPRPRWEHMAGQMPQYPHFLQQGDSLYKHMATITTGHECWAQPPSDPQAHSWLPTCPGEALHSTEKPLWHSAVMSVTSSAFLNFHVLLTYEEYWSTNLQNTPQSGFHSDNYVSMAGMSQKGLHPTRCDHFNLFH